MNQQTQERYQEEYDDADKNSYIRIRHQIDTLRDLSLRYFFDNDTEKPLKEKQKVVEGIFTHCIGEMRNETLYECLPGQVLCNGNECAGSCNLSLPVGPGEH